MYGTIRKKVLSILLTLAMVISLMPAMTITANAATTLSPGDIVIVAINGDEDSPNYDKGFSFMPLVNLEAGTVINFTDYGWSDVMGAFITDDGISDAFIHYTTPSTGIAAGTIIRCDSYHHDNFTYDFSYTGVGSNAYLGLGGLSQSDELLIFQGTRTSPTFIFAATYVSTAISATGWATTVGANGTDGSGSGSALPGSGNDSVADLVDDVTALSFNQLAGANDNSAYSGATTAAIRTVWQTQISTYSNWTFNDAFPIPTPPAGPFTVTGASSTSTVSTQAVSSISSTTATGNGNITALGSPNPTAHGVCWNTTGTPTTSDSKVDNGAATTTGAFTAAMTGLTANTTYYVRAYATNTAGTSYGTEESFTTSAAAPSPVTEHYTTETVGTNSFSEGSANFTITGGKLKITTTATYGLDDSFFVENLTNEMSTAGAIGSFQCNSNDFYINSLYLITLNGTHSIELNNDITIRGKLDGAEQFTYTVLYDEINKTDTDNWYTFVDLSSKSSYRIDELEFVVNPYLTYYVHYLMIDDFKFTIIPDVATAPTVSTQAISSISTTSATGNGNITALGTTNPTAHGVCWNTAGTPTTSDSKVDNGAASATGAFTASMTGLSPNTTYYVRAYATNTGGTSYGGQVSFTTSIAPSISTHPTNSAIEIGDNTSFTVTAAGTGLTYQWQMNTGSGFTSITNAGVYSGATTSALNLTGVTYAMNGYQYRVIVSGSVAPVATSNEATLTVKGPPVISVNDVSIAEGNAGTTNMTFTVSLDKAGASSISINYATVDNTAAAGIDYTSALGTLTFAPGETTKAAIITLNGDVNYENNETFYMNLSGASGATISDAQGVGTITNDDSQPTVTLSLTGSPLAENGGIAVVTATLSHLTYQNVAINLGYTGTAGGDDYTTSGAVITIPAGNLTGAAIITGVDDILDEENETVIVDIASVTNGDESGTQQVTATITDDDAPPSISINDLSVLEGDAGTATLIYTVTLSAVSGKTVTVAYATEDGTATTADSDYISTSGALTFSPGEISKTITVTVNGDVTEEADQTVLVNLSAPTNATISDSQGSGTITNDDGPPLITINDVSIAEGNAGTTNMTFTVSLDKAGASSITVDYATANNMAVAGADYTSASGILTFAPGETTKAAIITLNGDVDYENNETFNVNLTNASGATISDTQGVGMITNDDSQPTVTLSLTGSPLAENVGVAAVTATLSHLTYQNVAINLGYTGTAGGDDYTTSGAVITIPAGNLTGAAIITGVNDNLDEDNETVIVDIASVTNGDESGTQQVTAIITDDDAPPSISINDLSVVEGDSGTTTLQYTVTLSAVSGKTVTVAYATEDGTATTADSDYISTSGALTFNPGETSKTITVTVNGDVTEEADQTVLVNLSAPTNATISDSQGSGTITNDDGPPLITINDVSIAEGNAGTTDLAFTVSLNKAGASSIAVDYATADNTAVAGADYTSASGTLTFAVGETTKAAIITLNGDIDYEDNETCYMNLSNASGAAISDTQGLGTITNDDSQPTVTLSLTGSPLAENGGVAAVTATLSHLSYQNVTVNLGYTGIAAAEDYTTSGAVITIPAGSLTGAAIITGVDEILDEENETVIVDIASVTNGSESGTQQVTATITDDDAPPSISINDPSIAEGNAGTATLQYTVSLSAASGKTVTVDYATANGTATTAGSDYTAASGTLTFTPGETSKNINVTVNGDVAEELNETVLVNLSAPTNATISDSSGAGTIMNDEADLTPPAAVTNISLADSDTTSGVDGRDFTIGFDDSADDATDVLNYKIYVYKDGEEPANKAAMDALAAGNKVAVKTIARTAGDDGADTNLGSGAVTDSRGQALAGGDYWIVVTAVDGSGNYSFTKTAAKVTVTSDAASGGSSGSNNNNTPTGTTTTVIVNGQSQDAGTTTTSKDGDKTVTTVTLDDKKIQEKINAEGTRSTVSIPISGNSDIGEGVLNGQTVKSMEDKEAVLEIKTESVSYTLPASEINISDVSAQFGEAVQLKDIKISVKIAEPPADTVRVVQDTANQNNYQIVVKPVEFEITCTSGEKTVSISKFNGYVERTVAIPDGVDPSKITTGIVLNADGTFSHVPTTIVKIDGKYYAKINSLTNSTYSVIYNPVEFVDVAKHWAKDSINDMGSRLIVSGSGNGNYSPNKEITRAEFAAIVIRALGLKTETAESSFTDVKTSAWYAGYVETAVSYGIITGYSNSKFGPNDKITREQAMTMIARAMKLTGLYSTLTEAEMSAQISSYADGASSSKYAKEGVAACLKTGVVSGKSSSKLAPKDYITRAEVAVIIERMLEKSELI